MTNSELHIKLVSVSPEEMQQLARDNDIPLETCEGQARMLTATELAAIATPQARIRSYGGFQTDEIKSAGHQARALLGSQPSVMADVINNELRQATLLAQAIWEKHHKDTAPHWKPAPDLMGLILQIDNMTCRLTSHKPSAPADVAAVRDAVLVIPQPDSITSSMLNAAKVTLEFVTERECKAFLAAIKSAAPTAQPQAKALTDNLYILSTNEEAMEEAIERFNGSSAGEALKAVFAAQKSLRALLASQLWADMSTCKHVFMAVPINDSRAANVPAKAVCMHCGYEPEPKVYGEPSSCGLQGYSGTTPYPDLLCINGMMIDQDGDGYDLTTWYPPCKNCEPVKWAEWQEELRVERENEGSHD